MTDTRILRDTLELTLACDDTFPTRFYERLFDAHPEVRALFHRSTPGAQNKLFAQKLVALVDHLDDSAWLDRELGKLAASHEHYGVTREMYPWVGEALVATVREAWRIVVRRGRARVDRRIFLADARDPRPRVASASACA